MILLEDLTSVPYMQTFAAVLVLNLSNFSMGVFYVLLLDGRVAASGML